MLLPDLVNKDEYTTEATSSKPLPVRASTVQPAPRSQATAQSWLNHRIARPSMLATSYTVTELELLRNRVYETVGCPSVRLSVLSIYSRSGGRQVCC